MKFWPFKKKENDVENNHNDAIEVFEETQLHRKIAKQKMHVKKRQLDMIVSNFNKKQQHS